MFDVFDKFTQYFTWDSTDLDNWVWKLHSKASVAICMVTAALCICSTYFGNAIDCMDNEDPYVTQYCWIYGSYQFALDQKVFVERIADRIGQNCIPDDYYDPEAHERPTTAYYQWVIFMLFGHGILFMLPDRLWKFFEGGLVNEFVPFEKQDDDESNSNDKEKKARKFINLSKSQNKVYLTSFLACETLNFGVAIVNFLIIDLFLNGKFATYGTDVIRYLIGYDGAVKDPMCSTFPTLVSCEHYHAGTNGKIDVRNKICILSQNIINEKIYLLLWFWILILFVVSILMLFYRSCTILFPSVRRYELMYRARKGTSDTIEVVGKHVSLSQWFILSQIGRNSKSRDFNKFLRHLKPLLLKTQVSRQVSQVNNTTNTIEMTSYGKKLPSTEEPLLQNGCPA